LAGREHGVSVELGERVAVGENVHLHPHQHPDVAGERSYFSDQLRTVILKTESYIGELHRGDWEEGNQMGLHANRAGSRASAAVRGGEGLVQVEVDDVEAHVAGPRYTHQRVEVGAVVVDLHPLLMR